MDVRHVITPPPEDTWEYRFNDGQWKAYLARLERKLQRQQQGLPPEEDDDDDEQRRRNDALSSLNNPHGYLATKLEAMAVYRQNNLDDAPELFTLEEDEYNQYVEANLKKKLMMDMNMTTDAEFDSWAASLPGQQTKKSVSPRKKPTKLAVSTSTATKKRTTKVKGANNGNASPKETTQTAAATTASEATEKETKESRTKDQQSTTRLLQFNSVCAPMMTDAFPSIEHTHDVHRILGRSSRAHTRTGNAVALLMPSSYHPLSGLLLLTLLGLLTGGLPAVLMLLLPVKARKNKRRSPCR